MSEEKGEDKKNEFIAIVGMCGAGKSVVADYLIQNGYSFFRFGQIVLDEVIKKVGLKSDPALEKEIREGFRKEHGMAAMAILNKPKIDELLQRGNVVGDGLYSWSEYKYLKDIYKDQLKIVAVVANPEIRYERLEQRTTVDAAQRSRPLTKEQAKARDYAEIENIEKGGPISMADIVLINNGSLDEFMQQIKKYLGKNTKEEASTIQSPGITDYKRPTWDEYFMEVCKIISKRSTCERGRSGCVIARDKQLLVSGYAGSPIGMPHCDDVGHLFKKTIHEDGSVTNHCVRTVHAEQNAICQAAKLGVSLNGATVYCKMTPCRVCAMLIINSGIKRVVCEKRYHAGKDSEEMFEKAGIELKIINPEIENYAK